ncbi:helix-turn-helix domain-containing protein [Geofilum sp. OHC36d9]|uniref:helix-turn-helix domain-containing protein n=1 Tax=Geofilum sp. OHC36d9 TaxID=3458413 RepID=UPI00403471BC
MKTRLLKLMNYKGLTPIQFAEIIGVQRSSISHFLSGRNNPSLDVMRKILTAFPNISGDWLVTGEGSMLKSTETTSGSVKQEPTFNSLFDETIKDEQPGVYNIKNQLRTEEVVIKKPSDDTNRPIDNPISEKPDTGIERIVFFYSDGSFAEYHPK